MDFNNEEIMKQHLKRYFLRLDEYGAIDTYYMFFVYTGV